jgi:hypothetical protein
MMKMQRAACLYRDKDLDMPKGEQKKKTTNKPKLTVKEKKAKKKEKVK